MKKFLSFMLAFIVLFSSSLVSFAKDNKVKLHGGEELQNSEYSTIWIDTEKGTMSFSRKGNASQFTAESTEENVFDTSKQYNVYADKEHKILVGTISVGIRGNGNQEDNQESAMDNYFVSSFSAPPDNPNPDNPNPDNHPKEPSSSDKWIIRDTVTIVIDGNTVNEDQNPDTGAPLNLWQFILYLWLRIF